MSVPELVLDGKRDSPQVARTREIISEPPTRLDALQLGTWLIKWPTVDVHGRQQRCLVYVGYFRT